MTRLALLGFVLLTALQARAAGHQENSGLFLSARPSLEYGSTTYQNVSDNLNGMAGEAALGWRFPDLLKIGVMGIFENVTLTDPSGTSLGVMTMAGYGAVARLFFISSVFIEGSGGMTQAKFAPV